MGGVIEEQAMGNSQPPGKFEDAVCILVTGNCLMQA